MIISSSPLIDDEVFFRPTISKMQCITALDARKMLNCLFFRTSLNNFLIRKMRLFSSHLKAGTFKSVTDGFMILLRLFQRVIKWFEKCFTGGVCNACIFKWMPSGFLWSTSTSQNVDSHMLFGSIFKLFWFTPHVIDRLTIGKRRHSTLTRKSCGFWGLFLNSVTISVGKHFG